MSDSVYLWLAGPTQSWAAGRLTGNRVDTQPVPTRRALTGLIGAAYGWPYGHTEPWVDDLTMRVRADHPGTRETDFQTINPPDADVGAMRSDYQLVRTGRRPTKHQLAATPDGQGKTSIVRRTYLNGAGLLVEVGGHPNPQELAERLSRPVFPLSLGKRAFPAPTVVVGVGAANQIGTLPTPQWETNRGWWDAVEGDVGLAVYTLGEDVPAPHHEPDVTVVPVISETWIDAETLTPYLHPAS